jgi:hypothetical protein
MQALVLVVAVQVVIVAPDMYTLFNHILLVTKARK